MANLVDKEIVSIWTIDDVMAEAPRLNEEQALHVMKFICHNFNARHGVSFEVIALAAETLYPGSTKEISVTVKVVFKYEYGESIEQINADREKGGVPPMTAAEIEQYVVEDICGVDGVELRATPDNLTVTIGGDCG
jgi:hypothetical protein